MKTIKTRILTTLTVLAILGITQPSQAFTLAGGIDLGVLNLPSDLSGGLSEVERAISDPTRYFSDFLPINIAQIQDIVNGEIPFTLQDLEDIVGLLGLPDTDALMTEILESIDYDDVLGGNTDSTGGIIVTPGVNPAIPAQVKTTAILTEVSSGKFTTQAGQEVLAAQVEESQQNVEQISNLATLSAQVSEAQTQASQTLADGVVAQTSTQETLKTGLSGLGALIAAQSNVQAIGNQQGALSAELDAAQYTILMELGAQGATTNENLILLNEQFNQMQQREMAAERSGMLGAATSLQGLRAIR